MSKDLIQSQFSGSASLYATSPVHAKGASLEWLVTHMAPKPDWRVLDVATGPGHTAFAFAPHVAEVVASDLTPEMLAVARELITERGLTNVRCEAADAEALPFADNTFDAVTSRIAPHHFARIDLFLSEVLRVLKPSGVFGLVDNVAPDTRSTPGYVSSELDLAAEDYNAFESLRDPSHHKALQFTEWFRALEEAGFQVQQDALLEKPMAFQAWAERLGASADDITELLRMVDEGSTALRAFLRPEERDGARWMTWTEAMFVAQVADG